MEPSTGRLPPTFLANLEISSNLRRQNVKMAGNSKFRQPDANLLVPAEVLFRKGVAYWYELRQFAVDYGAICVAGFNAMPDEWVTSRQSYRASYRSLPWFVAPRPLLKNAPFGGTVTWANA